MKPHSLKPRRARNPFHEAPVQLDASAPPEGGEGTPYGFEEHGQRHGPPIEGRHDFDQDEFEAQGTSRQLFLRREPDAADASLRHPDEAAASTTPAPGVERRAEDEGDTRTADQRLRDDISEYLFMGDLDTTDIDLRVEGAAVTLTGSVSSQELKRNLEHLVAAVPGVATVDCQVRVKQPAHRPRSVPIRSGPPMPQPSWPNQFTTTWASPPSR